MRACSSTDSKWQTSQLSRAIATQFANFGTRSETTVLKTLTSKSTDRVSNIFPTNNNAK